MTKKNIAAIFYEMAKRNHNIIDLVIAETVKNSDDVASVKAMIEERNKICEWFPDIYILEDPCSGNMNLLHIAAKYGRLKTAEFAIEGGTNINRPTGGDYQSTALHLAIKNKHLHVEEYLLKKGADEGISLIYRYGVGRTRRTSTPALRKNTL
jgi:hypothetical protein